MKKLPTIVPLHFERYLVICLDEKWLDLFGKMPTFTYQVVDNRLQITSEVIQK